jgi:hypothetical protein
MDKINPLLGISLMVAAMAVNSSKDGIAKLLASNYSPLTILFIQFVTTSLILAPIVIKKNGVRRLIPDKLLPQALRSSFIAFGLGLFTGQSISLILLMQLQWYLLHPLL